MDFILLNLLNNVKHLLNKNVAKNCYLLKITNNGK